MNPQFPIPSFEDIRKILQFWISQQDKWFYFETNLLQSGVSGEEQAPNPLHNLATIALSTSKQTNYYLQDRIVGKIQDVVSYPPSLLLTDVVITTVHFSYEWKLSTSIVSKEERDNYGLVFSQITYYEPIQDVESFLSNDIRI